MPLPSERDAYVETTILVDALLKPGTELRKEAVASLAAFDKRETPAYALKEFAAGALQYCVWLHNCLVSEKTLSGAIRRINRIRGFQKNRAGTALEVVADQIASLSKGIKPTIAANLGMTVDLDTWQATEMRIALKTLIFKAWEKRFKLAAVVQPLACLGSRKPEVDRHGFIVVPDNGCKTSDCALRAQLQANVQAIRDLLAASDSQHPKAEAVRRSRVLKSLLKKKHSMSPQECRQLGDAVFAFFAPSTSAILTTNLVDHKVLASALRKTAITPREVLAP